MLDHARFTSGVCSQKSQCITYSKVTNAIDLICLTLVYEPLIRVCTGLTVCSS